MYPKIIGLVGPIRAGKSSVATYLCERYSYRLASNSDLLKDIAANLGMSPTRENLRKLGDSIFSVLGNDTLARYRLSKPHHFPIVVDGIRYKEEIEIYSQEPSFKLLGVEAFEEIRHHRTNILASEGKDQKLNIMQFSQLQSVRSELQVESLLELADAKINNNFDKAHLFHEIDYLMNRWLNKYG
ncbi:TPA: hypothetical protein LUJ82_000501 [Acinetobacter baumannii]|uniref:Dephospho-CoA kinase n=1 Tax=Acinetobacter baumannii TaxID=470 RepID=A0AA90HTY2_ACIBA|nr:MULTISPECIES: hypothetical protein [Acinetobacter calcoaceticus/baumannii complex]AYX85666.1 hypothetical protein EGX84_02630 [Acinetobacter baumannii]MBF6956709.1 hypothetical protein [Acinetobacter baumannii]MBV6769673.1 hypothetical protein [Acinetobacter baumannii]MCL8352181.1 hypothetical protein [Acinetobacter baumannii]MDR9561011.1 hypothetical protein [Acinetobacter baumannii]